MAMRIEAARQMVHTTAWRFKNGEYPVRRFSMAATPSKAVVMWP